MRLLSVYQFRSGETVEVHQEKAQRVVIVRDQLCTIAVAVAETAADAVQTAAAKFKTLGTELDNLSVELGKRQT